MVGAKYFSTGISIHGVGHNQFSVSLSFEDMGHAQPRSTSGTMRYTYYVGVAELRLAICTLKKDAEKLGIVLAITPAMRPTIYLCGDSIPEDWESIFTPIAESINFRLMLNK